MARSTGRNLIVRRGGTDGTKIAALRTKNPTINREPVDVTTDDDAGWRTLLTEPGQKQIDLSFSGITEDDVLITAIMGSEPVAFEDIEIELPSGATLHGDFFFNSLSMTGEYNQGVTFEGELQSSGPVVFAAAV